MPDDVSRRQLRRIMLPLLREGMEAPAALLILADALADHEPQAAQCLRAHPGVWGAVCVLPFGCWRCQEVLRHCRAVIRRYAAACYRDRRDGLAHPEVDAVLNEHLAVLSDREVAREKDSSLPERVLTDFGIDRWERSMRHVRRLVDRALEGHDVPPDIQSGVCSLREELREIIKRGR